jgi:GNAT superfamily N-acetyltransferase
MTLRIDVDRTPLAETITGIEEGLRGFNRQFIDVDSPTEPLAVTLRDDTGVLVGGAICLIRWHWLYIDTLWIAEPFRGQDWGSRVLAAAEAEGWQRGCRRVWLDTTFYQALPFYQRHGYVVFGTQHDNPPGYGRYLLEKALTAP